jgi:hypothetical protein
MMLPPHMIWPNQQQFWLMKWCQQLNYWWYEELKDLSLDVKQAFILEKKQDLNVVIFRSFLIEDDIMLHDFHVGCKAYTYEWHLKAQRGFLLKLPCKSHNILCFS